MIMKLQLMLLALIFYTFFTHTEEHETSAVNITIDARTMSQVDQLNDIDQQAQHTSLPTACIHNAYQDSVQTSFHKKELQPDETAIKFVARNGIKLGAIVIAAHLCEPLVICYCINRCIVQPLLDNGNILETVSEEEKNAYAAKGMLKVPDTRFFPIFEAMKSWYIGDKKS